MTMKKCFAYQCVVVMMLLMAGVAFSGCDKLKDDMDGMNIPRADYLYRAMGDMDYSDGPGHFDTAIRTAVGLDPIVGGADDKVIEACDKCCEELKARPHKSGAVMIRKIRHPDGKWIVLKIYEL